MSTDQLLQERHDRTLRILVWLSIGVAALVVFLAAIGLPKIVATADTTSAVRQSSDVAACRAYYNSQVTAAQRPLTTALANLSVLQLDGLAALAREDKPAFQAAVARVPQVEHDLVMARDGVQTAADQYRAKVLESQHDPARFLRECKAVPQ